MSPPDLAAGAAAAGPRLPGPCQGLRVLHTIGHSTRTLEAFLALLAAHRIACLVDVRRWPASRRFPHFAREALARALQEAGIAYVWRGDLGGYRQPGPDSPNAGWRVGAFRAYADFMLTGAFAAIAAEVEALAAAGRAALMCAEALPVRCHRQLLADAFLVRGWTVRHILDRGCEPHRLTPFARPEGTRLIYPPPATAGEPLPLDRGAEGSGRREAHQGEGGRPQQVGAEPHPDAPAVADGPEARLRDEQQAPGR